MKSKFFILKKNLRYVINIYILKNRKEELNMDKKKLITKIIAGLALALMLFSVFGTLLFYLIAR